MAPSGTPPPLGQLLPLLRARPPGPESMRLARTLGTYESPAVSTVGTGDLPIVWTRAHGANVEDADGNIYIDMTAAFGVASLGHANKRVMDAARKQSAILVHGLGDVHPHNVRAALVQRLAELAPGGPNKVILCTTGAEAVEVALKTAALYTGKSGLLAFEGAFHGQTYGALAVTSRERFRSPFRAQVFQGVARAPYAYCYRCPVGRTYPDCAIACLHATERLLADPPPNTGLIGAVIVEPVQGREGDVVPPPEFLPRLREMCTRHGVLLILDEMITGFSRTGAWFASMHSGIVPDLMCVGKALGNGLPVSACIGRAEVMDAWEVEEGEAPHSSTFMGNPVAGAAALVTMNEHERLGLAGKASAMGAYTLARLRDLEIRHPLIGNVRGLGMMLGIELVQNRQAKRPAPEETSHVIREALCRGVILLGGGPHGSVISLSPPLVITRRQLDFALQVLDDSLAIAGR